MSGMQRLVGKATFHLGEWSDVILRVALTAIVVHAYWSSDDPLALLLILFIWVWGR